MAPLLYLDPGTGSLLLYALFGIGATVAFSLKGLWYKIVTLFGSSTVKSHDLPDFVFHSEGGKYWQVFQPVIRALDARGVACAYVTPDGDDPAFNAGLTHLQVIHPGNEMTTIAYMNHIKTKVVVSTTPHLDVYMLKKSRHADVYAHLFHAPTDISFYEKYAFDYYDALLTVGPFQEPHVRILEEKRGTVPKKLYPVGNCYFDYQREQLEELRRQARPERKEVPVVLYAPTWGPRSSLVKYGSGLMKNLVGEGIRVIFRPHPQSWISHRELMDEIQDDLRDRPEISWDTNKTSMESMEASDLMITDVSGVLFDYAFLFAKPIVLMNADVPKGGFEAEDLPDDWDVPTCRALSRVVEEGEADHIGALVRESLADRNSLSERIRDFRDNQIYRFGSAGEAACDALLSLREGLGE
ncbi:MAG: CDP-glycerol glycerophosphotransferase family protein [Spirochaetales bacterium]|nr:CDP-glycerol glycerophosphotransferase family protein [Spirochaetales bacterium]